MRDEGDVWVCTGLGVISWDLSEGEEKRGGEG